MPAFAAYGWAVVAPPAPTRPTVRGALPKELCFWWWAVTGERTPRGLGGAVRDAKEPPAMLPGVMLRGRPYSLDQGETGGGGWGRGSLVHGGGGALSCVGVLAPRSAEGGTCSRGAVLEPPGGIGGGPLGAGGMLGTPCALVTRGVAPRGGGWATRGVVRTRAESGPWELLPLALPLPLLRSRRGRSLGRTFSICRGGGLTDSSLRWPRAVVG